MADQFVGEIRVVGFNFAPTGWAHCDGQILPISQNTALFALLGTQYGGNGLSTFALPDMQDNAPLHQGQGAGLSEYFIGETGGTPTVTLLQSEMPVHTHSLQYDNADNGAQGSLTATVALAKCKGGKPYQTNTSANLVQLAPQAASIAGSSSPHNNMQPYLVMNFIIALQGIFPARG